MVATQLPDDASPVFILFQLEYLVHPPSAAVTAARRRYGSLASIFSHLFCNSSQSFSFWRMTHLVLFIFQLSPNLLREVVVQALRGASPSFPVFQQVPSVTGSPSNSEKTVYSHKLLLWCPSFLHFSSFFTPTPRQMGTQVKELSAH